ncbi:MAG: hypothetical protein NWF07_15695 [Candidatus Bathyarchaeota archaeon]|nr:hypothetical protein [Candidatus Bathyarchaeota archaeon]
MPKIDSSLQNLILSVVLVILFNTVYYPIISTPQEPTEPIVIDSDIQLMIESPTNVLSGTVADVKIMMSNPEGANIVVKGIEYRFNDHDSEKIHTQKTTLNIELWDQHETIIQLRIPEIYQLDKIAETDIPVTCTIIVRYEENGAEEWMYTSYNMRIYDRFLDTENTERLFNNEPIAIT